MPAEGSSEISGDGSAERQTQREHPAEEKPWERSTAKPAYARDKDKGKKAKGKGKKSHKSGFAKSGGKNHAPGKPGSGPLKRKKPKTAG